MHRSYHQWHSANLGRTMEMLVFGHAGARVLVFPPRVGRFYDNENRGMIEALRPQLENGLLQLFCVDSLDEESIYCNWKHPRQRIERHMEFEAYILNEVLPFSASINSNPYLISHGCSLGAFHALNIALRHPQHFNRVVAFSGRNDLTLSLPDFPDLFGGYFDEDIYYHTPSRYLPNLTEEPILKSVRNLDILLAVGDEDPFYQNTRDLSQTLWDKGIWHALHVWSGRAHRFRYWRQMAKHYF